MRHLFDIDTNLELTISPQAYTLVPFKKIWDRDKSKNKKKALKDMAYIYWDADFRSFVHDITDPVEKHEQIISMIDDTGDYKIDDEIKEAIEFYKKDIPLSLGFLTDVKTAINELRRHFRELNLKEEDQNGKLVHNANQVMNSIKSTGDLLENLEKLEIKVKKDLDMQNSVRGSKIKGLYED